MVDGYERAITRINSISGEVEWVMKGIRAIPMCVTGKYAVVSPYGESPGLWNAVIDNRTGNEIWRLPPRLPFTRANNPIYVDAERDMLIAMSVPYYDRTDGVFCHRLSTGELLWNESWERASGSGSLFVTGSQVWLVEPADERKRDLVARLIETGEEVSRKRIPGSNVRVEWIEGNRILVRSGKSLYCYSGK
jgi:outer membrane protein assembly factor BamB